MERFSHIMLLAIAGLGLLNPASAFGEEKKAGPYEGMPTVTVKGTNKTASFTVNPKSLSEDITLKAPLGFKVSPSVIPAGTPSQKVTVTYAGYKNCAEGSLILKSGENKSYVHVVGLGTPLQSKDELPKVDTGSSGNFNASFTPGANGYTYEFRLASNEDGYEFAPYFVDGNGNGAKLYVDDSAFGYINARNKRGFSNPLTQGKPGGTGKFYNNDGKSHTYRIAVTPDNLAFVYRDGIAVDTINVGALSPQPGFAAGIGEMTENLLKNGDFEMGYTCIPNETIVKRMDGWDIVIGDRWNSEQFIDNQEMSADIDNDNHIFRIRPYKWGGGHWSDGSIEQVVDVVPGETYTLEVLAHGGASAKQGRNTGKILIREVQNTANKVETEIASDMWETYSLDYTPSEDCKQLSISFVVGKGSYNNDIKPVCVDNARLVGMSRTYKPKYGYDNSNATVEYVAFDPTGAYAPSSPEINVIVK